MIGMKMLSESCARPGPVRVTTAIDNNYSALVSQVGSPAGYDLSEFAFFGDMVEGVVGWGEQIMPMPRPRISYQGQSGRSETIKFNLGIPGRFNVVEIYISDCVFLQLFEDLMV